MPVFRERRPVLTVETIRLPFTIIPMELNLWQLGAFSWLLVFSCNLGASGSILVMVYDILIFGVIFKGGGKYYLKRKIGDSTCHINYARY